MAGRERERSEIQAYLDALAEKEAYRNGIVLYGPRGNGKTALQVWARREAEARGLPALGVSAAGPAAGEKLLRKLTPRAGWLASIRAVTVGGTGVQVTAPPPLLIAEALERRVRRGPLLLTIDEAHEMDATLGQELLNTAQILLDDGFPLTLILAGTPDLPGRFGTMGASFWNRSNRLRIGRLTPDSSADAIRIPFAEHGRRIEEDALARVVSESHGYPYFLQLWGKLLWQACPDPGPPVSHGDVESTVPRFEEIRNDYYLDRYHELQEAGLAVVAASVAAAFAGCVRQTEKQVDRAVSAGLERSGCTTDGAAVMGARGKLHDLGYIWTVNHKGRPCYEAGIPSLMAYVTTAVES